MNKKRAMGLSINVIIIAALGLIVLIIVAAIVKTQLSHYSEGYKKTANEAVDSAGGECTSFFSTKIRKCSVENPDPEEWKPAEDGECSKELETCWEFIGKKSDKDNS